MKKLLTFCVAIAAAMMVLPAMATGTDVTNKLVNANGDTQLKGWTIHYTRTGVKDGMAWAVSNHSDEKGGGDSGYWNWKAPNFELWNSSQTVVAANNISQTVKNLPNGTYVVGAFCVAARSGYDANDPKDYENAYGGYIYANGDTVAIATNILSDCTERTWLHARRFNVATTVTDGTLKVGIGAKADNNLFWLGFDNMTLYSFGDVSTDEALLAMAKLNLVEDVAVADSLKAHPMTAEGSEALATALPFAEKANTLDDIAYAEDTIRIACAKARRGVHAMNRIVEQLNLAKEVAAGDWSAMVLQQLKELNQAIESVEADLAANSLTYDQIDSYAENFQEYIDQVRIDALWDAYDDLSTFLYSPDEITEETPCFGQTYHPGFGEEEGQYSFEQEEQLYILLDKIGNILADIEEKKMSASSGFEYIEIIKNAVRRCVSSVNSFVTELPYNWITISNPDDPTQPYWYTNENDTYLVTNYTFNTMLCGVERKVWRMVSPKFQLVAPIQELSLTIGSVYVSDKCCLIDELYFFDGNGERIIVPESNISFSASSEGKKSAFQDNSPSAAYIRFKGTVTFKFEKPLSEFYIAYENMANDWRLQNTAFYFTLTGRSTCDVELAQAIDVANSIGAYEGVDPGFYTSLPEGLTEAIANAKEAQASGTDAEKVAATDALLAAIDLVEGMEPLPIIEGVEYIIPSGYAAFHKSGGVRKVMSVLQDSILWWETADPTNKTQRWVFEKVDASDLNDNFDYYNVKNVGTGKYLARFVRSGEASEPTGEAIRWGNPAYVKLGETPCRWRVFGLGYGQWGLKAEVGDGGWYMCHVGNHNSGNPSTNPGSDGGGKSSVNPNGYSINGVCGPVVQWEGTAGGGSSWYIFSDMETVPLNVAVSNEKKTYHFNTATSVYSLTADKNCAFENLKVYNLNNQAVTFEKKQTNNSVIIKFPEVTADFSFTFDNKEGVQTITIDASSFEKTKFELLQEAYNAVNKNYTEGTDVGNIKSLKDYNAAIERAEYLLENGGSDEELVAATEALYAANDGLEMVLPKEGKTYIIRNVANQEYQWGGQDVGIYNHSETSTLGYDYLDDQNPAFQWEFINVPELGESHFFIRSLMDSTYINYPDGFNQPIPLSSQACSWEIINNGTLNSISIHADCSTDINWSLHNPYNGTFGTIVIWGPAAVGSRFYVKELVDEETKVYDLEDLVNTNSPVIQRGVYDLTGRRIEGMPESGLYIIDGKKRYIRKR